MNYSNYVAVSVYYAVMYFIFYETQSNRLKYYDLLLKLTPNTLPVIAAMI